MKRNNRQAVAIAFILIAIVAFVLYLISKPVQGTRSELFLIGVVIAGAIAALAGIKDILELIDRFRGKPEETPLGHSATQTTFIDTINVHQPPVAPPELVEEPLNEASGALPAMGAESIRPS